MPPGNHSVFIYTVQVPQEFFNLDFAVTAGGVTQRRYIRPLNSDEYNPIPGFSLVTSDTAALAASKDTIKWEEAVSADKRNTHEELTAWMTKYFKQFPQGVCNTTSTCKRMENGGGNFVCGEGAGCAASSANTVLKPHLVIADVETGLGVGFTLFTGGHPDMHMFKMYGGQVYAVSAILSKGDSTGWD